MRSALVRLLFRYGLQAALVLSPLFTMGFSLLNLLGHREATPTDELQFLFFSGPKQEVELQLRILITAIALCLSLTFEAVDLYLPSRSLVRFRKRYLEEQKKEWRTKLHPDIRINIMYARRRWYFLWGIRVFEWTWNDGFEPPNEHQDANMWLCDRQGACGKALRSMRPQSVYLEAGPSQPLTFPQRWLFANEFRLWSSQLRRTAHLRAVISIPILEQSDDLSPSFTSVGVINLDTSTQAGAERLRGNERELAEYFMRLGKILAALRL